MKTFKTGFVPEFSKLFILCFALMAFTGCNTNEVTEQKAADSMDSSVDNSDKDLTDKKTKDELDKEEDKTASLPELKLEDGCNPLMGTDECMVPYPSDLFLVKDESTKTGLRLEFPERVKLSSKLNKNMDPSDWMPLDGFSYMPTIIATLGQEMDQTGWIGILENYEDTLNVKKTRTVIIDVKKKKLIPHYVDIDTETDKLEKQMIMLRTLDLLRPESTYIVAIMNVPGADGEKLKAPEGFRQLRDKDFSEGSFLDKLSKHYETKVFPLTSELGINRDDLQLAWYFTTGSEENTTKDMFRVRDLTLEFQKTNTPKINITSIDMAPESDKIKWKTIKGTISAPLFLDTDQPGAELFRDAKGMIIRNKTAEVPFTMEIPHAFKENPKQGRMVMFAHGFFGTRKDVSFGPNLQGASMLNTIMVGIDWWGMSTPDQQPVTDDFVKQPYKVLRFTDRVHQAMANWMTVRHALRTAFTKSDFLNFAPDATAPEKKELMYDKDHIYFVGGSQGHILGGVLAALDTHVERYVLNVGGAGFGHMLVRAGPFKLFEGAMNQLLVKDSYHKAKLSAVIQPYFDRIDPATYAPFVLKRPLEGSPKDRQVLLQIGVGDNQVPNVASYIHARTLGIGVTTPSPVKVYGVPEIAAKEADSAMTLYRFNIEESKNTDFYRDLVIPSADNGVHGAVRMTLECLTQMDAFFKVGGKVIHPCQGACDDLSVN